MKPPGLPHRFGYMCRRSTQSLSARAILLAGLLAGMAFLTPTPLRAQNQADLAVHAQRVMIRGLSWLQNGYPDRASAVFSEGLKIHPDNPALLGAMSRAQVKMGDLGTARFYLDQALFLAPDQPELSSQDLDLALASGDPQAARNAVDRLLALDGIEPALLLRHLSDLLDWGPTELSRRVATQSLIWYPDNPAILEAAITTLQGTGHLEEAEAAASHLATLTDSWAHSLRLARLQMQLGRWTQAEATLRPLVVLDPDDAEVRAMWTDLDRRVPDRSLLAEAGLPEIEENRAPESDSLGVLRAAWMANPDEEEPTLALIRFLLTHEEEREAALLAAEHVEASPRHLEVWVLGTRAWIAADEADSAMDMAETARLLFPGFPPVELVFVESMVAQGRTDEALAHLEDLISRWDAASVEHASATALRTRIRRNP